MRDTKELIEDYCESMLALTLEDYQLIGNEIHVHGIQNAGGFTTPNSTTIELLDYITWVAQFGKEEPYNPQPYS